MMAMPVMLNGVGIIHHELLSMWTTRSEFPRLWVRALLIDALCEEPA